MGNNGKDKIKIMYHLNNKLIQTGRMRQTIITPPLFNNLCSVFGLSYSSSLIGLHRKLRSLTLGFGKGGVRCCLLAQSCVCVERKQGLSFYKSFQCLWKETQIAKDQHNLPPPVLTPPLSIPRLLSLLSISCEEALFYSHAEHSVLNNPPSSHPPFGPYFLVEVLIYSFSKVNFFFKKAF